MYQDTLTSLTLCNKMAVILEGKLRLDTMEQVRRLMMKNGLLTKSLGRKLKRIPFEEVALFCIAISLPFSIPSSVRMATEIKAIPHFIDMLSKCIASGEAITQVSVSNKYAVITVKGISHEFGDFSQDPALISLVEVSIPNTVFSVAQVIIN